MDLFPKGDPPGFVTVLDKKTLAIPDRPGTIASICFRACLRIRKSELFFPVPRNGDTLRVGGRGKIVRDRSLQAQLMVNGKGPHLVLVATVEEAFMHCSKCILGSRSWSPEHWPDCSNALSGRGHCGARQTIRDGLGSVGVHHAVPGICTEHKTSIVGQDSSSAPAHADAGTTPESCKLRNVSNASAYRPAISVRSSVHVGQRGARSRHGLPVDAKKRLPSIEPRATSAWPRAPAWWQ